MFERPIKKYFVRQNNGHFKQPTKGNIGHKINYINNIFFSGF